ncbi:indole-3-glycerol phosphate synthase TrpC [Sporocytophaga myxococcoides]|uniref:indole-3-glycerol phosphate synthase TrpC n=1 Tax=Sporocytophaga myxococcoides TaxID=153721 RepID=UPI0004248139|nr:indole-3-glycerol phosphate synthase TrpC [Sporocytophaga myxococcoides]
MNILDKIIERKIKEVEQRKRLTPASVLEKSAYFELPNISFRKFLTDPSRTGIIAEFKRKSPSKGVINDRVTVEEVVSAYDNCGASAVSVLTDIDFFGGSDEDLLHARDVIKCPILRKEFIIDEYQILEAKSMGANVILLIAAVLEPQRLKALAAFTKSLGMEILMEVHDLEELEANHWDEIDAIGVNNRNLKTFEVSLETSYKLSEEIPDRFIKVSESGIHDVKTILQLKEYGFEGFLIGENFMKNSNPGEAFGAFTNELRELQLKQFQTKKPI